MSDHFAKSDNDIAGTAKKSMHHYQAAWMDHWKHSSNKPSTKVHKRLLDNHGLKDDHRNSKQTPLVSGPETATNVSKNVQGFTEVSEARTVEPLNKFLTMGSMKLGKASLDGKLPPFSISGNGESSMASKRKVRTSSNSEAVKCQIDLNDGHNSITMGRSECDQPDMECSSSERKLQPEGISWIPEKLVKSHEFLEKNSLAVSTIFKDDVGSSSKIVPYVVKSGVAPMQSFACQPENIDKLCPDVASKEHITDAKFCSYSTFWVHEKKANTLFEPRKLESSLPMQNDATLSIHDQSTKNSQLCSFLNKQSQKVENSSSNKLLPSLGCPEALKLGKAYDEHFLLPGVPHSVPDVKTMRICATIDSVEELPRVPSKFSQTTHQFLIAKKTGVNLTKGGQAFKEALVSSKSKGNMFSDFLSLSPTFNIYGQQGVKLQPLGSSTDSEGKDNDGEVRTSTSCLKNESSVETDAMELDIFQKSHLSSMALCPSDQNIKGVHNSSLSETENVTGEEARDKMANTELPDMNEGLPALPSVANSVDNEETSMSRTLSLDAEHFVSHAEQPANFKTHACSDGHLGPDPSSRWVKRLKLSTSEPFALGTKSSKMGEVSSHEEVNKRFSEIMNYSKTSSEAAEDRSHVRRQVALGQTVMLLKDGDSTSSESVRKGQNLPLFWIQRWCRYRSTSPKKPETAVLCEPQSSKARLDELQRKQFPSIAAMALMGKAMNGFHPCEFRRKGSTIVWST